MLNQEIEMLRLKNAKWLTVKQMPKVYPMFSESSIRWLIFNEKTNGFGKCVKRIGRKILIDIGEFENFIKECS